MQNFHIERQCVRFRAMHARNFAERALRSGFLDSEICAAYRLGLDETVASVRRDLDQNFTGATLVREPSQAVHRAWLRLWADTRSDEERWAAIFKGGAAPQRAFEMVAAPAAAAVRPEATGDRRQATAARVETGAAAAAAPSPAADAWSAKKKEQATIEKHLEARGLTLAALLKLSRPEQAAFLREALAAQRAAARSSQNGDFVNE